MQSILVTGVPKSGTTAAYEAMVDRFDGDAFAFLEPDAATQRLIARATGQNKFHIVTKIVLSAQIESDILAAFSDIVATVRDPRDVVVSWLPFEAVANLRLASNSDLLAKLIGAFDRKSEGDPAIDVTAIEEIYRKHGVRVAGPAAYRQWYDVLREVIDQSSCQLVRFEDMVISGRSPAEFPERLQFELVGSKGGIAVNQRASKGGEWKKWFSQRDMERY